MVAVAGGVGKVVQIIGTVVDIEFPPDQLPDLFNAVEIEVTGAGEDDHAAQVAMDDPGQTTTVVAEVQSHLGNNWVRALAMTSTDGMQRGARAVDTGSPIKVPVGPATLGRLFKDRKSTRLNSSHANISYAVFCLKKKNINCLNIKTTLQT